MELQAAKTLALRLMNEHGLLESRWAFSFDNATRRFGSCHYGRRQITLSKKLVSINEEARVRNTILHEIAHALTPGEHHNHVWRRMAIAIGCDGERCYSSKEVATPETRYIGACPSGHTHKRSKLTERSRRSSCGRCSSSYNPEHKITWHLNPRY
jgi:predicted SprT family Zn-dependent metalloprotease